MIRFDNRPVRRGVGDVWPNGVYSNDPVGPTVFETVSMFAGQGAGGLGQISDFLLRTGLTIEAVRNGLQNVATMVNAPAPVVEQATQELRYLNNNGVPRDNSSGLLLAGAVVLLLVMASRDR